jgi:hypothetical protein
LNKSELKELTMGFLPFKYVAVAAGSLFDLETTPLAAAESAKRARKRMLKGLA